MTLLNRIRENCKDESAWRDFVERYGSRIYSWCLNRKLKPQDSEDITQEILLKIANHFEKFEYDPSRSFRGWLRRVTENAVTDFIRSSSNRLIAHGGSSVVELLSKEPDRAELQKYLAEAFDLEILDEAKSRVKQRVIDRRWQSWDLLTNHGKSGKEVAEQLGISVGVTYANKNQVQKLIKEEIQVLESE